MIKQQAELYAIDSGRIVPLDEQLSNRIGGERWMNRLTLLQYAHVNADKRKSRLRIHNATVHVYDGLVTYPLPI